MIDAKTIARLKNLKEKVYPFLNEMNVNGDYSYFKYSYSGDLFDSRHHWGLGQLVFAAKILYMIDRVRYLSPLHLQNMVRSINSFQSKGGYYSDPLISGRKEKDRFSLPFRFGKTHSPREQIRRAETRQAFAALLCLGSKPDQPFSAVPDSRKGIGRYLGSLDWQNPWSAGSHFSHLVFFLKKNEDIFKREGERAEQLIDYSIAWLNRIQSPSDGCWYSKNTTESQKVNGAMKILTGLSAAQRLNFSYPEKIIDTALKIEKGNEACCDFNVVYVLYCCSKVVRHREDEIKEYCLGMLEHFEQYYHEEKGGFSLIPARANDTYYGRKITKGLNEPDIHGTVMFFWGITLISRILNLDLGFKEPLT